jgi:NADPH:quinone reductase
VVHRGAAVTKPAALTLAEAGAVGVPFVTALEGFRRCGMVQPGDVVLVMAANGMVGQAAAQIANLHGARVFGVTRRAEAFAHAHCMVRMIDASGADIAAVVREETDGHGADIVYNTVGSPYFAAANEALAHGGRQILISTVERPVPFDIFAFYRGRHTFVGIDSLALDARASAALLGELLSGFEERRLRPFPLMEGACYPMEAAREAYRRVHFIAHDRVILTT